MNKNTEHGGVFFYIILAIVLLAGLTYAVSQNNRGNTALLTDEQARVAATEIIDYGNTVAAAVQKLRLRGCSDTEISFENNVISGYTNPNAPTDNSCHVFDLMGGNLNWAEPPINIQTTSLPYRINGANEIVNIGTDCLSTECNELTMFLGSIHENVCKKINSIQAIANMPSDTNYTYGSFFTGAYTGNSNLADEATGLSIKGKNNGCFLEISSGNHAYYQVLIAR